MKNILIFDISSLLDATTGSSERFSFDGPQKFVDITTKSTVKGRVEIMRIDEGVNAKMEHVEITVGFQCAKCLKKFDKKIMIPGANSIFLLEPPRKIDDPNELFVIDKKRRRIDLTEGLRQEIILHFPLIPVCSSGCKGMCVACGSDRNRHDCGCGQEQDADNRPLVALRDLFKQ